MLVWLPFGIPFALMLRARNYDDYYAFMHPAKQGTSSFRIVWKYRRDSSRYMALCAWIGVVVYAPIRILLLYLAVTGFVTLGLGADMSEKMYRGSGAPTTFAELQHRYETNVTDEVGANELAVIIAGVDTVDIERLYKESMAILRRPWGVWQLPTKLIARLKMLQEANAGLISSIIHRTKADGTIRVQLDFTKGEEMDLSHLKYVRCCAELLVLDFILNLRDKDPAAAVNDLGGLRLLARYIGAEPILVSKLVHYEIIRMYCDAVEAYTSFAHRTTGDSPVTIRQLRKNIASLLEDVPINSALEGEAVFGLGMFDLSSDQLNKMLMAKRIPIAKESSGYSRIYRAVRGKNADRMFFLSRMLEVQREMTNSWPRRLYPTMAYDAAHAKAVDSEYWVSAVALPNYDFAFYREAHTAVRLQTAQLALEAITHGRSQGQSGTTDGSDTQQNSATAADPFSGSSYKRREVGDYELIYSVGRNRIDDTKSSRPGIGRFADDDDGFYLDARNGQSGPFH